MMMTTHHNSLHLSESWDIVEHQTMGKLHIFAAFLLLIVISVEGTSVADIKNVAFLPRTSSANSRVPSGAVIAGPSSSVLDKPNKSIISQTYDHHDHDPKREITVSKSLQVPFSADIAFDYFSDLPRQADYSPWLSKVEYINPPPPGVKRAGRNWGETKWSLGLLGFKFSWKAICTTLDRPDCLEWESTTGLKNYGRVVFEPTREDETNVTLTMTFVAPRVICSIFRRSSAVANFVQDRMLHATLTNFRDIVAREVSSVETMENTNE
jgi:uncharacterized membrane protein